ncbi:transcriptional regulator GcvA [Rhizobium sp. RCC_161_2]|uniref:transcriptional regulator GcvA n=1 Tax=Rhizobium sp. RCC_161_2 TaxID=3239219 RepID=UPI003524F0D8
MPISLPPLNPLRAFEVAARLNSFTLAADELNVSQVAVSRQVKALENYLGVVLVNRLHRGIELTREGKDLYRDITGAFHQLGEAAKRVSRRGRRDILAIQAYTTFAQRWLIPRLVHFHTANPRIEVRLSSSAVAANFETQNLDAAIRSGDGNWPGLHAEKLVEVDLVPVCSPALLEEFPLKVANDLSKVRLLHSMARPNDWATWLEKAGAKVDASQGVRFENSALAYEAASAEVGVAIAVRVFVERNLRSGVLVAPFAQTCHTGDAYYLTWPRNTRPSQPLMKFLSWVREQMDKDATSQATLTAGD